MDTENPRQNYGSIPKHLKKEHKNIGRWEVAATCHALRASDLYPIKYQLTTHTSSDPTQRVTQQLDYSC